MGAKGSGINLTAKLSVEQAIKDAQRLKKEIASIAGVSLSGNGAAVYDTKPLTGYQQAQLKLQQSLRDARLEMLQLVKVQKELEAEMALSKGIAQEYKAQVEKLKIAEQELKNQQQAGKISLQQYTAQIEQNKIAQQGLNAALTQAAIDDKKAATALKDYNLQQKQLAVAAREARAAQKAAAGSYDEADAKLKALGRTIKSAEGGFNSTNPAIRAQVKEYNNLNSALKKFDDDMGNHQRHIGKYQNALNGVTGDLKGLVAGYLSIQGAIALATKAFDVALSTDAIKTSLQFTLKSTTEVDLKMADLRATADRLGLSFIPLAEGYAKFTGAAKAANFSLTDSDRIFNSVSGAAARFHLTSDQLQGSLLAIQQMISKGTVQSEELRGQLGERLPGAFSIAARAMGVTEMELGKLLQSGQVLASDLLPKLATELDKTFNLDAATKIDSLTASTNRLSTTVDAAVQGDGIGKLFRQFIDGAANAISALDKLIQSRSFAELTGRLFSFDASKFDKYNDSQDSFASSQKRASTVTDPFSSNAETARENVSKLTKAYQDAYHAYSVLYDGVKSGLFPRTAKNLQDISAYKQNAIDLFDTLTAVNNSYQQNLKGAAKGTKTLTDAQLTSIKQIRDRIAELSKLPDSAVDGSGVNNRIDALKARLSGTTKAIDSEVNARNTLQKKINDLHNQSVKKQETADEQELTSVKLKYAAMREEAVKFNNDPKNKKLALRVDGSTINADEATETAAVRYKQEAKKQLESLDLQKKQYADYEQYKNELGAEMAAKRFGKEIVDNKTYLKKLQDEKAKIEATPEALRTGGQKDQLTELNKRIAVEVDAERSKYDTLLKQLQSYQDKVKVETEKYDAAKGEIAANPDKLNSDQLAAQYKKLEEEYAKKISGISVSELTESIDWSNLFSNLDTLAVGDIESLLTTIEAKFKDLSKTMKPIDLATARKNLQEARDILIKDNPFRQVGLAIKEVFNDGAGSAKKSAEEIKADWINLARATAGAFKFVSDAVESCEVLKDVLGEVGTTTLSSLSAITQAGISTAMAVQAASRATATTAVATSAAIKAAEKASVILAVISAALVVVQAIASVFKSIFNAGDKRIEKTIKGYQDQLDALDKGFKQLERDVQRSVGESFYADSLKEIENLNQQQALLQKQLDAERSKKHSDQDKIQSYQDQLDEIPNKVQDIQQSITDMLVQTTFKDLSSSLADAFTDAFAAGEDALERFDKAFNAVIANSVKKGLELKLIQPEVNKFLNEYADYLKANANSPLGFDFEKYKEILKEKGEEFQAGLEPFKDFFNTDDSSSSIDSNASKNIRQITSDQANALEGIMRGQYDQTKQLVAQGAMNNSLLGGIGKSVGELFRIATDTFGETVKIQVNTANTVAELKSAVAELKVISSNTKPTNGRGSGI